MARDRALVRWVEVTGIAAGELVRYRALGLVAADAEPDDDAVRRLLRARRLRRDLGLSYEAVEVLVRLLDRLDDLEGRRPPVTIRVVGP